MALETPRDPEQAEASHAPVSAEIPASTTLGPVHLTVTNLARSLDHYERRVGLRALEQTGGEASLGVEGRRLLALVQEPEAHQVAGRSGRYHFALLLPKRRQLAEWLAHAARDRVALVGLSDHFVSEAIYLSDPDGHGIEIYWDRPRERWEQQVASRMTTLPLDIDSLLGELPEPAPGDYSGMPSGTTMGHVHLKVASTTETISFYRDVLGFALMAQLGGQAAFLSAGGYHHHIGANTWESARASAPPEGTVRLRHATIVVPDEMARQHVLDRVTGSGQEPRDTEAGPMIEDPSGNLLLLATDG
jgi:catechol 2,3-dioxygenase